MPLITWILSYSHLEVTWISTKSEKHEFQPIWVPVELLEYLICVKQHLSNFFFFLLGVENIWRGKMFSPNLNYIILVHFALLFIAGIQDRKLK